jgi:energy-coupling factor transporter ATP-binding protein EcfA2
MSTGHSASINYCNTNESINSDSGSRIPLYAHTLDTICDELVSGRSIRLDAGKDFKLSSIECRAIFNWYYRNKNKWSGQNRVEDVKNIVEYLKIQPPNIPAAQTKTQKKEVSRIHLKKIRAHRFAGIHKYGDEHDCPEDFEHEFQKQITLIHGENGSGKTSLVNAIVWCLTGHIYRPQRLPEKLNDEIEITTEDANQQEILKTCTVITPIPEAKVLQSIRDNKLLLDTWVELTFEDNTGKEVAKVRRAISRTSRGKLKIEVRGIDKLGLDPVALEVGTKMAGMIPYIQIEEASDLGKAIASLTGLRPLEDLVKHAVKTKEKLKGQLKNEKDDEIYVLDKNFSEIYTQLKELINTTPSLSVEIEDISNNANQNTNSILRKQKSVFEDSEAKELERAKDILGKDFDPTKTTTKDDLTNNVGKALGLIEPDNLRQLPSLQRLGNLKKLTEEEIKEARDFIENILKEGSIIEELEKKADHAARERLYANIGRWIRQNKKSTDICPVCDNNLKDKNDKVTGKKISEHLKEHASEEKEYLSKAIKEWSKSWIDKLSSTLTGCLVSEMKKGLPSSPVDLISKAFIEELFDFDVFKNSLSPLKGKTQDLSIEILSEIEAFNEPKNLFFSKYFIEKCEDLKVALERINRAISFAEWRKLNDKGCRVAYEQIIGNKSIEQDSKKDESKRSLYCNLSTLDQLVNNTTPIRESILKIINLRKTMTCRRKAERLLKYYKKTVTAIDDLIKIKILVKLQVEALIQKLSVDINTWKDKFYSPAYTGVPKISDTNIDTKGSIIINAEIGGTKASSKHICNSSDLRATLLAVLVSFWKYLMDQRGCISLIIFDDLQELFDKRNRRLIANSLQDIIKCEGSLLITTNDTEFVKQISRSNRTDSVEKLKIHPIKTCSPHIRLGVFREDIHAKREEYKKPENENEHQPARDYINELRIYIEDQLQDFFDEESTQLPSDPCLRDFLNGLRRWQRTGQQQVFTSQPFINLLNEPALRDNSEFVNLMHESHHGNSNQIMYTDVERNDSNCCKVLQLVEHAHEEYERWMRRDPISQVTIKPEMPDSSLKLKFKLPVYENLAAVTSDSNIYDINGQTDIFSAERLGDYAVYVVNSDSLGFSVKRYSRVIVKLSEEPVEDNSLVIALHKDKIYARRFLQQHNNPEVIALSSEDTNPIKRAPSLLLPVAEVRLLEIIGVIFDENPFRSKNYEEAYLIEDYKFPYKPQIAFKIRGESGLPFALPDQIVLGDEKLLPSQIEQNEGKFVAIAFSGKEAFKRIGECIPSQPRLRLFESIGGLGESILVRTEEIENDPFDKIPLFETAYRIIGIIYLNSLFSNP